MPPRQGDKASAILRKDKGPISRKSEKPTPLLGWEIPTHEDDDGIVAWMRWNSPEDRKQDKKLDGDEDCDTDSEIFRQFPSKKCQSIENISLFERESLNERFLKNCQFTGSDASLQGKKPKSNGDVKQSEDAKVGEDVKDVIVSKLRTCKSASPCVHSPGVTSTSEVSGVDAISTLPPRSHSVLDKSQLSTEVADLPEGEIKVKKLVGLAQKYMRRNETVQDEGEDNTEEGYGSKVSNNDVKTETSEEASGNDDVDDHQHGSSTFQWIRDVGNNGHNKIVKLSYSQRDRTVYGVVSDQVEAVYQKLAQPITRGSGRDFRGIMAASLSNLSPSSLQIKHMRDSGGIGFPNYGATEFPRWGYENNSCGQFLPNEENKEELTAVKPSTLVLRKVTIQNAHSKGDAENGQGTESKTDEMTDDKKRTTDTHPFPERSKFRLTRTSPELKIDSTKMSRTVSIPSAKHQRDLTSFMFGQRRDEVKTSRNNSVFDMNKNSDLKGDFIISDIASQGFLPIGDLLPAVEKSLKKTQQQRMRKSAPADPTRYAKENDYTRTLEENSGTTYTLPVRPDDDSVALLRREMDMISASYETPHGPPAFRPLYTRSPLQRAKEIANRRLHGHVTQLPDGSSTVHVSSPRFAPRRYTGTYQHKVGSADRFPGKVVSGPFKRRI